LHFEAHSPTTTNIVRKISMMDWLQNPATNPERFKITTKTLDLKGLTKVAAKLTISENP
jgi:hypothetical protein